MGVLGTSNSSVISGAFIARGQDYIPVFDVAPDWESYDFKKLDLDNEEDKKYFEAALAWDLELDGKAWADGKNVSLAYTLSFLISIVLTSKLPTVQVKCVFIKDLVASPGSTCTL